MSKAILHLLWFCIAAPCDWPKNPALLSQPIRSKPKAMATISHVFSPPGTNYMYLLQVLIGSLDCLCQF